MAQQAKPAKPAKKLQMRCLVACRRSDGMPTMVPVVIHCSQVQADNGEHYDAAIDYADSQKYETNAWTLVADHYDCPDVAGLPVFADDQYWGRVPEVTI